LWKTGSGLVSLVGEVEEGSTGDVLDMVARWYGWRGLGVSSKFVAVYLRVEVDQLNVRVVLRESDDGLRNDEMDDKYCKRASSQ
jgi:hypothetical protein